MKSPLAAPIGALFLLAACSGQSQSDTQPVETKKADVPATDSGVPIELTAIDAGEMPVLEGELGCSFTIEGQPGPAFVAKANVGAGETAFGAYKSGNQVRRVAGPGGFAALEKGMELSGPGIRIAVKRLATSSTDTDSEQTSYPARITADRTYAGERSYDGVWTCGP